MADARGGATYAVEPDFAARQSILWAIAWLIGAVTLGLIVQVLLIRPSLVGELPFLNYGRLRGAADTAIVFGWLGTSAFAAIYALIPRIANVQLHNEPLGSAVTLTYALVLTGGILGLLLGVNQGRPLAELGIAADVGIGLMFVMVLYNAGVTVIRRRERTLYASGWFLLAAALLAPIIFAIGNLPAFTGVIDSIVSGFYLNGLEMLWLLPVALGVAHYVVPVETGKPLYSSALARTTFWSLLAAGGWTGQRFFMQGPAPDYLDTIAFAMTLVLVIPVLSAAANLFTTGAERWHLVTGAFGLRFAATGLAMLGGWIVLVVLSTAPSVYRYVGLTAWQAGVRHLAIFGVFSSFAFAFIYHAYPLMVGRGWYSPRLASVHFWTTTVGTLFGVALLLATGAASAAGPMADGADVVVLLRILTAAVFALVVAAQYALAYNAFKTSRSGPYLVVAAQPTLAQAVR